MAARHYHNPFPRLANWCLLLVIVIDLFSLLRALPAATAQAVSLAVPATQTVSLPWPSYGQAALGAQGYGLLAENGKPAPVPIASVAKVITALAVLNRYPLAANADGPMITLSQSDINIYNSAIAEDGSAVAVSVGEQISERQLLEGMLLASANNMATSLADWAFGSLPAYEDSANSFVSGLGMINTHMADASGFAPQTVSTAEDLIKLGQAAMDNSAIAEIVSEKSATLPVAGQIYNYNQLLGSDGIIGIKTGNTDQAGGTYLFAVDRSIGGQTILLIGATLGAPDLATAMSDSHNLVLAADQGFQLIKPVKQNDRLAVYKTHWGTRVDAVAASNLSVVTWKSQVISVKTSFQNQAAGAKAGKTVGQITLSAGSQTKSVSAVLAQPIARPSILWRLLHP